MATVGIVWWKAVSKHATCGISFLNAAIAVIGARLCGSCSGAIGVSLRRTSSSSGVTRSGRTCSLPPCTTRCPTAASRCPPRWSSAQPITAPSRSSKAGGDCHRLSSMGLPSPSRAMKCGEPPINSTEPRETTRSLSLSATSKSANLMLDEPPFSVSMASAMGQPFPAKPQDLPSLFMDVASRRVLEPGEAFRARRRRLRPRVRMAVEPFHPGGPP